METAMGTRIGVDLGTTWTAAAISAGRAEVLQLGTHTIAMPSAVAVDGDGIVVGEPAERRLASDPASGAREVKRRLGDTTPIVVGGRPYGPEALMAPLLAAAIDKAGAQLGAAPDAVTLTHPANWGEYKLDLLREIARLAGRDDVDLLPEPAAAALHYAQLGKLAPGDTVAVYDFGGGTFDVAVVRCDDDSAAIIGSPNGLERLGGVDLDQIVLVHVDNALDGLLREVDATKPEVRAAVAELRAACTAAKEALSSESDAVVRVAFPDLRTEVRVTRAEFEAAVRARVEDTLSAFDRAVSSSGVAVGDLAGVLMVGGSSRIPVVAELVAAHTGRPLLVDADAKAVVALGAAGPGALEAAQAAATAVAERKKTAEREKVAAGRTRGERGAADVRVMGAVAGTVAAAGAAAAGFVGYQRLTDDDGGEGDGGDGQARDRGPAPDDESMDAFDEVVSGGGGGAAGGRGGGFGGFGGFSDTPAGRAAQRVFAAVPATDAGPAPVVTAPAGPAAGSLFSDPAVEAVRAELRERLAKWAAPAGADPEAVADMKADLEALLDHYHAYPGQPIDDAIATLRYQFEDRVRDFAQDEKIDALLEERDAEMAAAEDLGNQVDALREQLRDRLADWQAPPGADPDAVAEMKSDLAGILDRFTPVPGQTADDALADLRARFNDRVKDFAQDEKLDAVIDELSAETAAPGAPATEVPAGEGTGEIPAGDATDTTTEASDADAPAGEASGEMPPGGATADMPAGEASGEMPPGGATAEMPAGEAATSAVHDPFDEMIGADAAAISAVGDPSSRGGAKDVAAPEPATEAPAASSSDGAAPLDDALGADMIVEAVGAPASATAAGDGDLHVPLPETAVDLSADAVTMTSDDLGLGLDAGAPDGLGAEATGVDLPEVGEVPEPDSDILAMADAGSLPEDEAADDLADPLL
jgi:actin-like ATPase involved in cell morphogenesis